MLDYRKTLTKFSRRYKDCICQSDLFVAKYQNRVRNKENMHFEVSIIYLMDAAILWIYDVITS